VHETFGGRSMVCFLAALMNNFGGRSMVFFFAARRNTEEQLST
jgi:hypothetical protein